MKSSATSSSVEDVSPDQHKERSSSERNKVWRSASGVKIPAGPSADILTYTFANLGRYDMKTPIFIDALNPSNTFSARDMRLVVRKLIAGLKNHGLELGDCVCLHAFNSIWYPLIWLFLITETTSLKVAGQAASACDIPSKNIFVLAKCDQPVPAGRQAFIKLLNHGESDWLTFDADDGESSSRTAAYCTTSGTTGLPKAAKIPHSYVVAQAKMIQHRLKSRSYRPSQLICLPVFHTFAAPISLVLPLRLGITTYFLPRFDLERFVDAVNTFEITDAAIVPPILTKLLQLSPEDDRLMSLRYILCAGAPLSSELQSKLYAYLHSEATIGQVWGATELGWVSMFAPGERDETGSVGMLLPGIELKLKDAARGPVGEDLITAEALVHSPSLFSGYLDNVEASAEAFDAEGFYHTGDLAYVKDDNVYIDGRIKDVMKVNSWQVSPSEIENVLLQHPEVADAAVVGVTSVNEQGLEITKPRAYIVMSRRPFSGNSRPSKKDLQDFVASRLVSYKRLTAGVVFVDAIPRSLAGKILRRLLLAQQPNGIAS